MLIEEIECRARAREKEKAALMRDAKLEVAYNIISEVYREAAAESYPNWTKQKQNDMDEVADCTHVILKQIIYLSHKLDSKGVEPSTFRMRTERSSQLSYEPSTVL